MATFMIINHSNSFVERFSDAVFIVQVDCLQ